jgi:DNA-binding transcriptional regulator YhcF (GntR family)
VSHALDEEPGGDLRIPAAVYARVAGDPLAVALLVSLTARAAWSACVRTIGGRVVDLQAGDVVTSRDAFARATGLTPAQVRRALERLEEAGIVAVQACARGGERGTRITVLHLTAGLRNSQQTAYAAPTIRPTIDQHETKTNTEQATKATAHETCAIGESVVVSDPRKRQRETHERPTISPTFDLQKTYAIASNVEDHTSASDLGSGISSSPDPGSDLPSPEPPDRGPRDLVQPRGRDPRAEEQGRLVRVIGNAHVVAHARLRRDLGLDSPGKPGYVPAMQPIGDPAERALRDLVTAQASVDGLEERLRHVLAVGAHEAEHGNPPSLRWFGAALWSERGYARALALSVGEERRPARASPPGPTEQALAMVRELEAKEAEEERLAAQGG